MSDQPLPQGEDPVLLQLQRSLASVYKVERLLGRGGMAAVYQAVEINPPRPVALKVLPPGLGLGAAAARFKREARLAVSLNHPNIVPIYRVGLTAGAYFFAMKLVEGRTLDAIVESQGALPLPAILVVLRATTTALAYAHERGSVHGDLKGANILVDRDGRVMLSDFGIARAVEEEAPAAAGKARFRVPEHVAGGTVGPPADQYSLGIIALQMIAGSLPPDDVSLTPTPDVRAGRGGIPDQLVQIVQTALARDPARRFASAADMLTAIEAIPFGDADRREAYAVLGKLARGEQVTKVRVPAAAPRADAAPAPRTTTARPVVTSAPPAPAAKPATAPPPATPSVPARPAFTAKAPAPRVTPPSPTPPPAPTPRPTPPPAPTPRATPAPRPAPPAPAAPIPRGTYTAPSAPTPRAAPDVPPVPPTIEAEAVEPAEAMEPVARAPSAERARISRPALFGALSPEPKRHRRLILAAAVVLVVVGAGAAYLLLGRGHAASPLAQAPPPAATQTAAPPVQPVAPAPVPAAAESARTDTARRAPAPPPVARGDTTLANETTGLLLISTVPNTAEISVDGQPAGAGGFLDSEVTAGRRRLRVYAPGYETIDTFVRVVAGGTLNLGQVSLRESAAAAPAPAAAATGRLRLRTVPPTAEIFVDGQSVGVGSLVDFEVTAGPRQLRISAPGYLTLDTLITVDAGATVRLGQVALRPEGGP
jgi:serine/threonine-protein kinase